MSAFEKWAENNLWNGGYTAFHDQYLDAFNAGLEAAAKACEEHGDTATAYLIRAMIEK